MPISKELINLLPELRRFSATLNGSVEAGDECVLEALQYLVNNRARWRTDLPPRVALYRTYLEAWSVEPRPERTGPQEAPALAHLAALSPEARQAFLLTAVESFSPAEAAAIMDVAPRAVSGLLRRAAREFGRRLVARILIIEDRPTLAMDLESIVTGLGHTVVGVAAARRAAVAIAAERKPGLIMAELELAGGGSGLRAVNGVLSVARRPVVLIADRAIRPAHAARLPKPAVILPRPFSRGAVKAAVSRALLLDIEPQAA